MFDWYAKIRAQAEASNPPESTPYVPPEDIPREVFSEEFEWKPYKIHRLPTYYLHLGDGDVYETVYLPITLTGRWKITKFEGGESKLELEVKEEFRIKNPNYLSGMGGVEIRKHWLEDSRIAVRPSSNETINVCGE